MLITLSKIAQKYVNKSLFYAKFYGAWHEKNLDPKALTFEVWGPKTS